MAATPKRRRTTPRRATTDRRRPVRPAAAVVAPVAAPARTVVYVHGIGNKPPASILKAQWDQALFDCNVGERSRMAYWVDRERYPSPERGVQTGADYSDRSDEGPGAEVSAKAVRSPWIPADELRRLQSDIDDLVSEARGRDRTTRRQTLSSIATAIVQGNNYTAEAEFEKQVRRLRGPSGDPIRRVQSQRYGAAAVEAKVLDFVPRCLRQWITRQLVATFLYDVNDFFFDQHRSQCMRDAVRERLRAGGGPFIVIGHSQGSMIAYTVLMEPEFASLDVPLLVTIGSPLGITEVKDNILRLTGQNRLAVPPCVARWENVADPLDPVALDKALAGDYRPNARGIRVSDHTTFNVDSPRHPHSGTGYLSLQQVREPVRTVVDTGLFQPIARFKLARDVNRDFEDMRADQRQKVLLQLADFGGSEGTRRDTLARVLASIEHVTKRQRDDEELQLEVLDRYVSVSLTRQEAETLASQAMGETKAALGRIWKNAAKWALLDHSIHTTQAFAAHRSYQATGEGITWAVLDSGVHGSHVHFGPRSRTLSATYDCTARKRELENLPPDSPRVQDRFGHGAHVAGIIAGRYVFAAGTPEERVVSGMAPDAQLVIYKVLDDNGYGDDAWVIKAIDHIYRTNEEAGVLRIHGVNLSLGGEFDVDAFNCGYTPLCEELRRLWQQGVVVVVAAGNEGFAVLRTADGDAVHANMVMSLGDPGNLEEAIVVGSTHRDRPHTYGTSYFSSRGPTADGRMKPDCVAPGERIVSVRNDAPAKPRAGHTVEDLYTEMSGTSMAAPHVSGVIAAFLSKRREFIGRPDDVKRILLSNCTDLGRQRQMQGAGIPNLVKMLVNV